MRGLKSRRRRRRRKGTGFVGDVRERAGSVCRGVPMVVGALRGWCFLSFFRAAFGLTYCRGAVDTCLLICWRVCLFRLCLPAGLVCSLCCVLFVRAEWALASSQCLWWVCFGFWCCPPAAFGPINISSCIYDLTELRPNGAPLGQIDP